MWVRSLPAFRASRFQLASPTITRTVDINLTDLEQNHTGQLNVSWKLIYSFNLAGEREENLSIWLLCGQILTTEC